MKSLAVGRTIANIGDGKQKHRTYQHRYWPGYLAADGNFAVAGSDSDRVFRAPRLRVCVYELYRICNAQMAWQPAPRESR
jgi:hypothetical protein